MTETVQLPPAYRLVALDRIGSTNDEGKRLAREGAEDGTLIWAREQTAGRGRAGRAWSSLDGNLFLSAILRPDCPVKRAAELSFVAAVALADAVEALVASGTKLALKWPNDLLVDGAKASGLLLEAETYPNGALAFVVLGIGVNVRVAPEGVGQTTTSLEAHGSTATAADMLQGLVLAFDRWRAIWEQGGFAPIAAAWRARAWRLGEEISVAAGADTRLTGRFVDLDGDGTLLLDVGGQVRRIAAGDVLLPDAVPAAG